MRHYCHSKCVSEQDTKLDFGKASGLYSLHFEVCVFHFMDSECFVWPGSNGALFPSQNNTKMHTIYTYMYVSVVLVVLVDFPHVAFSQMVIPERDLWTKLDT